MNTIEKCDKYVLNTYKRFPITFVKGKGVYLYTDDGRKMLDMGSGIAVSSLGHADKKLVKAISGQAGELIHTSNLYYTKPCVKLAEKLVSRSVFGKVFFCNSGAEANEAAIKLARKHGKAGSTDKFVILSMKNSFHGRTITTLSATGQTKYQAGFEPMTPGFAYVGLNDITDLEKAFDEKVAAVIVEPIQGEGGIISAKQEYLARCRELCDKYGALLIYDEIQTGVGRTGKLFAYEHFLPVEPDIITLAKGLGGGMPIGAMLVKEEYAGFLKPGEHASTFGGNPVCAKAGCVVLDTIEKDGLLKSVAKLGEYFKGEINRLKAKHEAIRDVRGLGFLLGIEFDFPGREMVEKLLEKDIVTIPSGEFVVRFIPPLIAKKNHFDSVIEAVDSILSQRT
jgi:acetylornithine/N-succinyldiaminopimelate aminotransferase